MKTPEQIARETFRAGMMTDTSIQDLLIRAIEADRAQRPIFADGVPNNDAILTGEW